MCVSNELFIHFVCLFVYLLVYNDHFYLNHMIIIIVNNVDYGKQNKNHNQLVVWLWLLLSLFNVTVMAPFFL